MRITIKRLAALAVTLAMVLTMASCGGSGSGDPKSTGAGSKDAPVSSITGNAPGAGALPQSGTGVPSLAPVESPAAGTAAQAASVEPAEQESVSAQGLIRALVDGWIYYGDSTDRNCIYRIRTDGSAKTKLTDVSADYIAVDGDWLFYYDSYQTRLGLYKVKMDGSDTQKLSDDQTKELQIADGWLYYKNDSDTGRMYKMRLDASENQAIGEDIYVWWPVVVGDWIYFGSSRNKGQLIKVKTDGSARQVLSDDEPKFLYVMGDWAYYSTSYRTYRVGINGGSKELLIEKHASRIRAEGDTLYYSAAGLYRMRMDGSAPQQLSEDSPYGLYLNDGWVYFESRSDDMRLCAIRIDGSGLRRIDGSTPIDGTGATQAIVAPPVDTGPPPSYEAVDIASGYIFAIQGNTIYYRNSSDGYSIYSINTDGSAQRKISEDRAHSPVVLIGDSIYYSNADDDKNLYMMKSDGAGREKLTRISSAVVDALDGWIYIIGTDDFEMRCLLRMRVDSNAGGLLSEEEILSAKISRDWIYYFTSGFTPSQGSRRSSAIVIDETTRQAANEARGLYKMRLDGSDKRKLSEDRSSNIVAIIGDWIYYSSEGLCGVKTDGSGKRKLMEEFPSSIFISGDWIYYSPGSRDADDPGIYRMKTDGSFKQCLLSDEEIDGIYTVGDWIYFSSENDDARLYKMKYDGSGRQALAEGSRKQAEPKEPVTVAIKAGQGVTKDSILGLWQLEDLSGDMEYPQYYEFTGDGRLIVSSDVPPGVVLLFPARFEGKYSLSGSALTLSLPMDGTEQSFTVDIAISGDEFYYVEGGMGVLGAIRATSRPRAGDVIMDQQGRVYYEP